MGSKYINIIFCLKLSCKWQLATTIKSDMWGTDQVARWEETQGENDQFSCHVESCYL